MTDMESLLGEQAPTPAGGRRAEKSRRRGPGCLIALVILAVLAAGLYYGVTDGIDKVKDQFGAPADYPGPGTDEVIFEVNSGDTATDIGRGLKDAGVVASVDAFIDAAQADPKSSNIQAGFYSLQKQMKASDALAILDRPREHRHHVGRHPRGPHGAPDRRPAGQGHRLQEGRVREGAQGPGGARAAGVRRGEPGGLPVPGDLRLRPGGAAGRHAARHGGALAAGRRGERPRGRRPGAGLHAARDHDDRQPDRGRGPRRVPRQDLPGHLQPAGEPRQRAHQRAARDRRHRQLRAGP